MWGVGGWHWHMWYLKQPSWIAKFSLWPPNAATNLSWFCNSVGVNMSMVLLQLKIAHSSNVNEVKPGVKQTTVLLAAVKRHNSFTLPTIEGYLPVHIAAIYNRVEPKRWSWQGCTRNWSTIVRCFSCFFKTSSANNISPFLCIVVEEENIVHFDFSLIHQQSYDHYELAIIDHCPTAKLSSYQQL